MKFVLALAAVLALPSLAPAQTVCTANCVLTAGQTYGAAADHDGVNTTGYRFLADGSQVGPDVTIAALSSGVVTFTGLIAPSRGAHTLQLVAFNEDGGTPSNSLSFSTKKLPPGKPNNPRILTVLLSPFKVFANLRRKPEMVTFRAWRDSNGAVAFGVR